MTTPGTYPFTINNVPIGAPVEFNIQLPYPDIDEFTLGEMSTKMMALQEAHWDAALKREGQPIIWQSIAVLEITYDEEIPQTAWSFTLYNPIIDYNTGYAQNGELGNPIATYSAEPPNNLIRKILHVWFYMKEHNCHTGDVAKITFTDYETCKLLDGHKVKFTNS